MNRRQKTKWRAKDRNAWKMQKRAVLAYKPWKRRKLRKRNRQWWKAWHYRWKAEWRKEMENEGL